MLKIYWPTRGLTRSTGIVLGWRSEGSLIVVGVVPEDGPSSTNDGARSIDYAGTSSNVDNGGIGSLEVVGKVIGALDEAVELPETPTIQLNHDRLPVLTKPNSQIILFDPPDPRRLRFFTFQSCHSPSTVNAAQDNLQHEMAKQACYARLWRKGDEDNLEKILGLLNGVDDAQRRLLRTTTARPTRPTVPTSLDTTSTFEGTAERSAFQSRAETAFDWKTIWSSGRAQSPTLNQLGLRFQQISECPANFRSTLDKPSVDLATRSKRYMQFWNVVWLILNDLIMGFCVRQVVLQVPILLETALAEAFSLYMVDSVQSALLWLNDWPVGLKLNTPLSQFFCTALGLTIQIWSDLVVPRLPFLVPVLINVIAAACLGGLTLGLSFVRDLISLSTLHLWLCYKITRGIRDWQLDSLGGLWNLFRGKRWNVLRQRTDSYAYDVDQLFLGTLLFTVSIFLLPTVLTYAALFTLTRVLIIALDRVLFTAVMALNAFPLFELMLRVKEPSRLPAGVFLVPRTIRGPKTATRSRTVVTHLEIRNSPRSVKDVLRWSRSIIPP